MGKPVSIPLQFGGMVSAGDSASMPDGKMRLVQNSIIRPLRMSKRPVFTYDLVVDAVGLANFDDSIAGATRLLAFTASTVVYEKSASGESWTPLSSSTVTGQFRVNNWIIYRGVVYMVGVLNDTLAAFAFDGTDITSLPFCSVLTNVSELTSTAGVVFDERIFLAGCYFNFVNMTIPYDWSGPGGIGSGSWTLSGATGAILNLLDGSTICTVTPTSTTGAYALSGFGVDYSSGDPFVWRQDLSNSSPTYDMPFTMRMYGKTLWQSGHSYNVGDAVTNALNIFSAPGTKFVCSVAGVSGGSAPTWMTAIGSSTTDNTVTWMSQGTSVFASMEGFIPAGGQSTTFSLSGSAPKAKNVQTMDIQFLFGNTSTPIVELHPITVSVRDGKPDLSPIKRNSGSQLTVGEFEYPFFNKEPSVGGLNEGVITTQDILFSEIGTPNVFHSANTYKLRESPGNPTAMCVIGGRLVVFKRHAFWVFQGTTDPDIPIRRERPINTDIGCIGPVAHDEFENETFFICESDIYRYKAGDDQPTPFTGDGIREEILANGSGWVESQSTYKRPILCIDKRRLLLYVYTQKSKLYVFDLRSQQWSVWSLPDDAEIDAMLWNHNTGNVYVAFGGRGLARIDFLSTTNDAIDGTASTYTIADTKVFRPVELPALPRADLKFKMLHLFYSAPSDQSGQTFKAEWSMDQGTTYPRHVEGTLNQTAVGEYRPLDITIPDWSGSQLTVRITHTGKGGEDSFILAPRGYVDADVESQEYPNVRNLTPTSVVT